MRPPDLLTMGAREALLALQKEEAMIGARLRRRHEKWFMSLREQLKRWFLSAFVLKTAPDRDPIQVWDPLKAQRTGMLDELGEALTLHATGMASLDEQEFEEALDEAFIEGHRRELWLLAMGGIPAGDYAPTLPARDTRQAMLVALGVGGLSWIHRLHHWRDWHMLRTRQWVTASVMGGHALDETDTMVSAFNRQYDSRVSALLGNEMHRANGVGAALALDAVQADFPVDEMWLTRDDKLVCPVCESLHLTVTRLQPVTDTHPSCRCWKVPVPENYRAVPVTYTDFVDGLETL